LSAPALRRRARRVRTQDKAKAYYGQHKWLGSWFVYLVPLHIFASLLHGFNGVNLFKRFKFN
jgi:cytochrome b561